MFPQQLYWLILSLPCTLSGKFIHSQGFSYHPSLICSQFPTLICLLSTCIPDFLLDIPVWTFPGSFAFSTSKLKTSFLQRHLLLATLCWPMAPPCSQLQTGPLAIILDFSFIILTLPHAHPHLMRRKASNVHASWHPLRPSFSPITFHPPSSVSFHVIAASSCASFWPTSILLQTCHHLW